MTTPIVTRGAGFLGSHLREYLLGKGHQVLCLDNLDTGTLENIERIRDAHFAFRNVDVTERIDIPSPLTSSSTSPTPEGDNRSHSVTALQ
jgi:dTDP-glucose 4,6-dehydratase